MDNNFNTEFEQNIVCPHCGHDHGDNSNEYFFKNDVTDIECDKCEKEFNCERILGFSYTTAKIPCKEGEPHKYRFFYEFEDEFVYRCSWCKKIERRQIEEGEKDKHE